MRVLLHDIHADRYFQSLDNWTQDPDLARDLKGTVHAVNLAFQNRWRGVEIILAFDESQLTMRLPLEIGM